MDKSMKLDIFYDTSVSFGLLSYGIHTSAFCAEHIQIPYYIIYDFCRFSLFFIYVTLYLMQIILRIATYLWRRLDTVCYAALLYSTPIPLHDSL